MASPSKESNLLKPFFNYPTKQWSYKELREKAKISEPQLNKWLHKFVKEELIKRVKKRGKMPYYIGNYESPNYRNTKKLFAFEELHQSGLLNHLLALQAKTIVIFGSFSRWDWYERSDIDVFIYGKGEGFKPVKYETKLHREIQIFHVKNIKDLRRYGSELIKNIIRGNFIKGNIKFLEVKANAKI